MGVVSFANADLIVVGAGFYGMTIAERAASQGFRVVVIDKRDHIGGNAYSYLDSKSGIEVHKYGPHVFHTNSHEVFDYLSRFTEWTPYEQRTWTVSKGRVYPMPINLGTICLYNGRIMSPGEARSWVAGYAGEVTQPRNLEEKAISLIGLPLYRGIHSRIYTEAMADRAYSPASGDHHPLARSVQFRQPLLQRHISVHAAGWLHPDFREDARQQQDRRPSGHRLSTSVFSDSTPVRSTARTAATSSRAPYIVTAAEIETIVEWLATRGRC